MIHLVCLEGCHGIGKTTLIEKLAADGFNVIKEGFFDSGPINPKRMTSPLNEIEIMRNWYKRVIAKVIELEDEDDKLVFIDRSPFACCAYMGAHEKPDIHPMINSTVNLYIAMARQFLYEMVTDYEVTLMFIHMKPVGGVHQLLKQIHKRMEDPAERELRMKLREDSVDLISHVDSVLSHCATLMNSWFLIPNFRHRILAKDMFVEYTPGSTRYLSKLFSLINDIKLLFLCDDIPDDVFSSINTIDPLLQTLGVYHGDLYDCTGTKGN